MRAVVTLLLQGLGLVPAVSLGPHPSAHCRRSLWTPSPSYWTRCSALISVRHFIPICSSRAGGWGRNTAGRVLALHAADPAPIPSTLYSTGRNS